MLEDKQLERALEKLLELMEEKGIRINDQTPSKVTGKTPKEELIDRMKEDLRGQLSAEDIKNVEVQKKLISCITSFILGKTNDYKDMVNILKSSPEEKEAKDERFEHKLKAELVILASLSKVLDPTNQSTLKMTPESFRKGMKEAAEKDANLKKSDEKLNLMDQQMDMALRNLYGGDNPTISGEIEFPIQGPIFGNLFGFTNQSEADPVRKDFMTDSITYNTDKMDYLGLEAQALLSDLSESALDVAFSPTLERRGG